MELGVGVVEDGPNKDFVGAGFEEPAFADEKNLLPSPVDGGAALVEALKIEVGAEGVALEVALVLFDSTLPKILAVFDAAAFNMLSVPRCFLEGVALPCDASAG